MDKVQLEDYIRRLPQIRRRPPTPKKQRVETAPTVPEKDVSKTKKLKPRSDLQRSIDKETRQLKRVYHNHTPVSTVSRITPGLARRSPVKPEKAISGKSQKTSETSTSRKKRPRPDRRDRPSLKPMDVDVEKRLAQTEQSEAEAEKRRLMRKQAKRIEAPPPPPPLVTVADQGPVRERSKFIRERLARPKRDAGHVEGGGSACLATILPRLTRAQINILETALFDREHFSANIMWPRSTRVGLEGLVAEKCGDPKEASQVRKYLVLLGDLVKSHSNWVDLQAYVAQFFSEDGRSLKQWPTCDQLQSIVQAMLKHVNVLSAMVEVDNLDLKDLDKGLIQPRDFISRYLMTQVGDVALVRPGVQDRDRGDLFSTVWLFINYKLADNVLHWARYDLCSAADAQSVMRNVKTLTEKLTKLIQVTNEFYVNHNRVVTWDDRVAKVDESANVVEKTLSTASSGDGEGGYAEENLMESYAQLLAQDSSLL